VTKTNSVTTAPLADLVKIIRAQISNIEENSSILAPFNQEEMNLFKQKLSEKLTLQQLLILSGLLPNKNLGYDAIIPLSNPIDTTCLQLSKGNAGWYWCYGTDYETKNSFMFYIIRVDLAPKHILKKLGYSLGQGTLYFISAGVGIDSTWTYSPFTVVSATNTCTRNSSNGQTITWGNNNKVSLTTNGKLKIDVAFKKFKKFKKFKINVTMTKIIPAYFNAPQGCAPCTGGAGTNYWSYPAMSISGTISSQNAVASLTKSSIGWLDHQWGNDYPKQPFIQIINTIITKDIAKGLGKYIWITLHMKSNTHYMMAAFPPENVAVGDSFNTTSRKYTKDGVTYGIKCTIKITGFTATLRQTLGTVSFPNQFEITLQGDTYKLNGNDYGGGKCVTIDLSNNLHYSGSASLTGGDALSGFIEGNQFQTDKVYKKTRLSILGMESDYDKLQSLTIGGKAAYAYIVFIIWILLNLVLLIFIIIQSVYGIKKLI